MMKYNRMDVRMSVCVCVCVCVCVYVYEGESNQDGQKKGKKRKQACQHNCEWQKHGIRVPAWWPCLLIRCQTHFSTPGKKDYIEEL